MPQRKRGIPVIGEMELASPLRRCSHPCRQRGTNGKSTVTSLLGALLRNAGHRPCGRESGTPLMDYVAKGEKADYAVVEVSSFQLDTIERFLPPRGRPAQPSRPITSTATELRRV